MKPDIGCRRDQRISNISVISVNSSACNDDPFSNKNDRNPMKMQFIMLHTHNARKATMHIAELYASFKTPICLPQLSIKRNAILQWIKALLSQLHLSWTTIHETIYNLFPLFLEHIRINRPPCNKHLSLEDGSLKRHRYSAWIPSAVHTWEGFFQGKKISDSPHHNYTEHNWKPISTFNISLFFSQLIS